jgi:hypothetical protein
VGRWFGRRRLLAAALQTYRVRDRSGVEIDSHADTPGYTLEYAMAVMEDHAFVLYNDRYIGSSDESERGYVAFKYSDAGWEEHAVIEPVEPAPHDFGFDHRFDAEGALYVIEELQRVRRYPPGSPAELVWQSGSDDTWGEELVHYYVAP